jgi:hypothetical protein
MKRLVSWLLRGTDDAERIRARAIYLDHILNHSEQLPANQSELRERLRVGKSSVSEGLATAEELRLSIVIPNCSRQTAGAR